MSPNILTCFVMRLNQPKKNWTLLPQLDKLTKPLFQISTKQIDYHQMLIVATSLLATSRCHNTRHEGLFLGACFCTIVQWSGLFTPSCITDSRADHLAGNTFLQCIVFKFSNHKHSYPLNCVHISITKITMDPTNRIGSLRTVDK